MSTRSDFLWDPSKHPRDRRGRFTKSRAVALTEAEISRVRKSMDGFSPKKFATHKEQTDYLKDGPKLSQKQIDAVETYTGDAFLEINKNLRAGKTDGGDPTTVKNLRAAFKPTEDDLVLRRTVSKEAFGSLNLKNLKGMKIKDAGFSSTSLGFAYGGELGNVQIKIAVPKGTDAIFAAKYSLNPSENEVLLPDGMEFAVTHVEENDKYGFNVSLVVVPKS